MDFPQNRRASGSDTWVFGLLFSKAVKEHLRVGLSHPVCGGFLWQPKETNTESLEFHSLGGSDEPFPAVRLFKSGYKIDRGLEHGL